MSSLAATLPNDVIVGVAYNTADYGTSPIHQTGPYNSLNIGIPEGRIPSVGSDDSIFTVYWDSLILAEPLDSSLTAAGRQTVPLP